MKKPTKSQLEEIKREKTRLALKSYDLVKPQKVKARSLTYKDYFDYLDWPNICHFVIRNPEEFVPKSYNINKNIENFIKHCFVKKYPPPDFLWYYIYSKDYKKTVRDDTPRAYRGTLEALNSQEIQLVRSWFIHLARGESFKKVSKDVFNAKEAHYFLNFPDPNENNIFLRAQVSILLARGIPFKYALKVNRCFPSGMGPLQLLVNKTRKIVEVVNFFANYHEQIPLDDLQEICDYINYAYNNTPGYSLKDRTASSIIKFSNTWHNIRARHARENRNIQRIAYKAPEAPKSWPGLGLGTFFKHKYEKEFIPVQAKELTTTQELQEEGYYQRHCVGSYSYSCANGSCSIVSLRYSDKIRITLQITKGHIYQAKGKLNKMPNALEMDIIKEYCKQKNVFYE